MTNPPFDMNLRSKANKSGDNQTNPDVNPSRPSALMTRTPSSASARGRMRGAARGSVTNTAEKVEQNTRPNNGSHTGTITKTRNPVTNTPIQGSTQEGPTMQERAQEGLRINEMLDQHTSRGTYSLQDRLGDTPLNAATNNVQGAGANFPFQSPPEVEDSASLMDELIYCKRRIKEMSMQMSQLKMQSGPGITLAQSAEMRRASVPIPVRHYANPPARHDVEEPADRQSSHSESDNSASEQENPPFRNYRHYQRPCEMDKWRIKFSGGNGIKFLKKVEKLQKAYEYDDRTVYKYFYLLLDGHALEWYWQYSDQYENSDLAHLKREIKRVFKPRESDMVMISAMYNRKQNQDTFEKFYNDVVDMNFSLKDPLSDQQLIEILRTNVDDEVRQRIFTYETRDRIKFFHKANQAYFDVCKTKDRRKPLQEYKSRRVHEIDFDNMSTQEIEEISSKFDRWKSQKTERTCYNCHLPGHLLSDCPEEITRFFCFKCGMEGTVTPRCPKCSLKGNRGGE